MTSVTVEIYVEIIGEPETINIIKTIEIRITFFSIRCAHFFQKIFIKRYPSNGGSGIILKTANAIFITINICQNNTTKSHHDNKS